MKKTTVAATLFVVALTTGLVVEGAPPAAAKKHAGGEQEPAGVDVRGGWFNDVSCVPLVGSLPDENGNVEVECNGTTVWDGDFTGRTIVHALLTMDSDLNMRGTYEELFVGAYTGDGSTGGLRTAGTAVIENGAFHAEATIVRGTCAWSGSSGSFVYDGSTVNGGYVGRWVRPTTTSAADPTCNPAA